MVTLDLIALIHQLNPLDALIAKVKITILKIVLIEMKNYYRKSIKFNIFTIKKSPKIFLKEFVSFVGKMGISQKIAKRKSTTIKKDKKIMI